MSEPFSCVGRTVDGGQCGAHMWLVQADGLPPCFLAVEGHVPGCDEGADVSVSDEHDLAEIHALITGRTQETSSWLAGLRACGVSDDEIDLWPDSAWQRWARMHWLMRQGQSWLWASGIARRLVYDGLIHPLAPSPGTLLDWCTHMPYLGSVGLAMHMSIFDHDLMCISGRFAGIDMDAFERAYQVLLQAYDAGHCSGIGLQALLLPDGHRGVIAELKALTIADPEQGVVSSATQLLGQDHKSLALHADSSLCRVGWNWLGHPSGRPTWD